MMVCLSPWQEFHALWELQLPVCHLLVLFGRHSKGLAVSCPLERAPESTTTGRRQRTVVLKWTSRFARTGAPQVSDSAYLRSEARRRQHLKLALASGIVRKRSSTSALGSNASRNRCEQRQQ